VRRGGRAGLRFEIRLLGEALAGHAGDDHGGKAVARRVERLRRLVEAHARDRDAVLRPLELRLQIAKRRRRLEIGIGLADHQQPRQRRRQPVLRLLEALERRRILGDLLGRLRRDLADARARFGHRGQRRLLEVGRALDGLDEIGDQVGAALVNVLDLGPLPLHRLVQMYQPVVAADRPQPQQRGQDDHADCRLSHSERR